MAAFGYYWPECYWAALIVVSSGARSREFHITWVPSVSISASIKLLVVKGYHMLTDGIRPDLGSATLVLKYDKKKN